MNLTIIGCSFAALAAIKKIRRLDLGRKIRITVIAPEAVLTYLPSLIWIPSGLRNRETIRVPLAGFFERNHIHFHHGEATGLTEGGRTVVTTRGEVTNDILLVASGGSYIQKLPGIEHSLNPCSGVAAAEAFQEKVAALDGGTIAMGFAGNPKEPTAVRGGPMFEFLFGLHNQLLREGRRERFELAFFTPMPEPGKRLGPKAVRGLLAAMAKRNVVTHLGHKMVRFEADKVVTEGGEIPADAILFIPGMTGPKWLASTGLALSPGGFLQADAHCRVDGAERVYVAGDAGSFPGPEWRAKQAHMAEVQAAAAADNIVAEWKGRTPDKTFRTELVCIVDDNRSGTLISRFPGFNLILPPTPLMHWMKLFLEWKSLYPYR